MIKTRVLVVEAETNTSAELDGRLRRLGYELTARADTGEAAIRAAKDSRPDVVLMDIGIDGTAQGTETASYFQENLKLPVIFLSANSSDTTIFRVRDTGPFGFILTPCDERELKVAIEMAVLRHRNGATPRGLTTRMSCKTEQGCAEFSRAQRRGFAPLVLVVGQPATPF